MATDGDIQKRLDMLYSNRNENERRQKAQEQIAGQQFCKEEQTAALCIIGSKVQIDRAFKDALWQQVSTDEEYGGIVEQLQDPAQPDEIIDQSKKYKIKQDILKIHQEDQNNMYQYWRTVIPEEHGIKIQVLKEIHCVPY